MTRRNLGALLVLFALAVAAFAAYPAPRARAVGYWVPDAATTWEAQWDASYNLSRAGTTLYDLDLFAATSTQLATLHSGGNRGICYFTAGTVEDGRPDSGLVPARDIGNAVNGWPSERWLDIRDVAGLSPYLLGRLDLCRSKGFDGVDPDETYAAFYDSGFPLTYDDQRVFDVWLADRAHERGLSIAAKNMGLLNSLGNWQADIAPGYDYAAVEFCTQNASGCYGDYAVFKAAGKALFDMAYGVSLTASFCQTANSAGWNVAAYSTSSSVDDEHYVGRCSDLTGAGRYVGGAPTPAPTPTETPTPGPTPTGTDRATATAPGPTPTPGCWPPGHCRTRVPRGR